MIASAMIAEGMHKSSQEAAQRIISLVLAYAPLPNVDVRPKAIFRRLASDKKTLDGLVHFILPHDVGQVDIVTDVPERAVLQVVEELRNLSQA
jgi:3-dehydroquinate synthetase